MRIGMKIPPPWGMKTGVEYYALNLAENLILIDKDNEYIFFICFSIGSKMDSRPFLESRNSKKKIIRLPINSLLCLSWAYFSTPPIDWIIGEVDLFHAPYSIAPPLKKGNLIYTVHDLVNLKYPELHTIKSAPVYLKRLSLSVQEAKRVIAVSENTKNDLMEFTKVPEEKIRVIPEAPRKEFRRIEDAEMIKKIKRKYNLNQKYILSVCTLEPRKNLKNLIRSFSQLKDDMKKEYSLVIVGKKGWLYNEIFEEIKNLKLHDRVKIIGYVPENHVPVLMNGAEVFVYPSIYEGFGLPPLEAMACGIPVISSNSSSLPEVIGDAGILFNPYDTDELTEKLSCLLSSESLKKEMSIKGEQRARLFSWEKTAKETLKVYYEACND